MAEGSLLLINVRYLILETIRLEQTMNGNVIQGQRSLKVAEKVDTWLNL